MKINLDGTDYTVSLDKSLEQVRNLYTIASTEGLKRPDGKILFLGGKSPFRAALKVIMTPFIIPMIKAMYADSGLLLAPPIKHENLIDYVVHAVIDYIKQSEGKVHVFLTSETSEGGDKTIKSLVTTSTDRTREIDSPPVATTETAENKGR